MQNFNYYVTFCYSLLNWSRFLFSFRDDVSILHHRVEKLLTAEIWIHIWCSFLQKNVWWKISPPTPLLISIVALNQTLFAVQELMSSTNFRVARYTMLWWNKALWLAAVIPVTSFYKSKSFISAYKFLCNRSNFHCWKVQTLNI